MNLIKGKTLKIMGSGDFAFIHFDKNPDRIFPVSWEEVSTEESNGNLPWKDFKDWLLSQGGIGNGNVITVDYGNNGSITYQLSDECIFLDNHAELIEVLNAYRFLLTIDEDVYIFDYEGGIYDNEESFSNSL